MEGSSFTCHICSKSFKNQAHLQRHANFAHSESNEKGLKNAEKSICKTCSLPIMNHYFNEHQWRIHLKCQACKLQFSTKSKVLQHLKEKHPDFHITCDFCDTEFFARSEMKKHLMAKHCQKCNYKFEGKSATIKHLEDCNPTQIVNCAICDFQTSHQNGLVCHYRNLHPEMVSKNEKVKKRSGDEQKPRPAKVAKMEFVVSDKEPKMNFRDNSVKKPLAKNDPQEKFQCEYCEFCATSKRSLGLHCQQVHGKPLTHRCENCSFTTFNSKTLWSHKQMCLQRIAKKQSTKCIITNTQKLETIKESDSKGSMKCDHCEFRSDSKVNIGAHCKQSHGVLQMKRCKYCSYGTRSSHLWKHEQMCKQENVKTCNLCDFKASSELIMSSHVKKFHESSKVHVKYECKKCPYSTFHEPDLYRHSENCNGSQKEIGPDSCPHCSFQSKSQKTLGKHCKLKHGVQLKKSCPNCSYQTHDSERMKAHQTVCNPANRQKCDHCDYIATSDGRMSKHCRMKHGVQRRKSCKNCSFSSFSNTDLKRHSKSCSADKVISCQLCDFKAISKWRMVDHKEKVHGCEPRKRTIDPWNVHDGIKRHCKNCSFFATNEINYRRHLKRCDPSKIQSCAICGFKTISTWKMEMHSIEVHATNPDPSMTTYSCKNCDFSTIHIKLFKKHELRCASYKVKACSICNFKTLKKSVLMNHLRKNHTKECFVKLRRIDHTGSKIQNEKDVRVKNVLRDCFIPLTRFDEVTIELDQLEYSFQNENGEEDVISYDFCEEPIKYQPFIDTIEAVEDWNRDAQDELNIPIQDQENSDESSNEKQDFLNGSIFQPNEVIESNLPRIESVKRCIDFDKLFSFDDINFDDSPMEP